MTNNIGTNPERINRFLSDIDAQTRYWRKVSTMPGDLCWEWNGYRDPKGYGRCPIYGWPFAAHRISYTLAFGAIPDGLMIDHKCHNRACVNPDHLRVTDASGNSHNCLTSRKNKSGFKGVFWNKEKHHWRAAIRIGRKYVHLGGFKTPEEAHDAYKVAATALHGEFACFGGAA